MKYFPLIAIVCLIGNISAGPCGDVSLSACSVPPDSVVDVISLPDSQEAAFQCQTLCASINNCKFFRYDHQSSTCSLLESNDYRQNCQLYSGPGSPTLEQCFSGEAYEDACDAFTNDNCGFLGEVVLDEDNVHDLITCEHLLVTLGQALGASIFVFVQENNNNCKLYKDVDKYCQTFSGPSIPDYSDCGSATTWKPTPSTPSPTSPRPPGPNIEYEFCSEGEQSLEILNAWVSPFPIIVSKGGSYDIHVNVLLNEELPPNSQLKLKIYKTGLIDFPIPCCNLADTPSDSSFCGINWPSDYFVGSCEYSIEHLLEAWSGVLCGDFFPEEQECTLPLKPGVYRGTHTVHFPKEISDIIINMFASGTYKAEARTILEDGTVTSCVRWFYELGQ